MEIVAIGKTQPSIVGPEQKGDKKAEAKVTQENDKKLKTDGADKTNETQYTKQGLVGDKNESITVKK